MDSVLQWCQAGKLSNLTMLRKIVVFGNIPQRRLVADGPIQRKHVSCLLSLALPHSPEARLLRRDVQTSTSYAQSRHTHKYRLQDLCMEGQSLSNLQPYRRNGHWHRCGKHAVRQGQSEVGCPSKPQRTTRMCTSEGGSFNHLVWSVQFRGRLHFVSFPSETTDTRIIWIRALSKGRRKKAKTNEPHRSVAYPTSLLHRPSLLIAIPPPSLRSTCGGRCPGRTRRTPASSTRGSGTC